MKGSCLWEVGCFFREKHAAFLKKLYVGKLVVVFPSVESQYVTSHTQNMDHWGDSEENEGKNTRNRKMDWGNVG